MKILFSVYDFFGYLSAGYLLLYGLQMTVLHGFTRPIDQFSASESVFWLVISYIVGHLEAGLSSLIMEKTVVRKLLGRPEDLLLLPERRKSFLSSLFRSYFEPLPQPTSKRVLERAAKNGVEARGRALFFHCHPIVMNLAHVRDRLNSFLNLYGFCRNISFCGLLLSLATFSGSFFLSEGCRLRITAGVCLLLSIGLFYRYLKFYRLYTVEVFRVYGELQEEVK